MSDLSDSSDSPTARALVAINRAFYRDQAASFSRTRRRGWPGWERILATLPRRGLRVLDLGCGNGRWVRAAADAGLRPLTYVGVDASAPLLREARDAARQVGAEASVVCLDLASDGLAALHGERFDLVVVFGLLHHLPGRDRRLALLERSGELLAPGGQLAVSVWDFGERARFRDRRVPWHELPRYGFPAIDEHGVEDGDHLLRWGEDQVRYCHQVSKAEREHWIGALPWPLALRFSADGASGDLNEYLVFRRDG